MTTDNTSTPTEEFDRTFDAGDDVGGMIDWSKGKRLHGGRRLGSGRKPTGRKGYTVRLRPEVHANIVRRAQKKGVTLSEYIEQLVEH